MALAIDKVTASLARYGSRFCPLEIPGQAKFGLRPIQAPIELPAELSGLVVVELRAPDRLGEVPLLHDAGLHVWRALARRVVAGKSQGIER